MKIYMNSHMANYKQCFVVYWNSCQLDLQEVGLMQSMADHVSRTTGKAFGQESRALTTTWLGPLACVWRGLGIGSP